MKSLKSLVVLGCVVLSVAHPAKDSEKPADSPPSSGNLKYTFGSKDEIPAAFFDSDPLKGSNNTKTSETSVPPAPEIRSYPACQDGSGGMCVDAGQCPANLKPETQVPGACATDKECCFGVPENDKSCRSRGGECRVRRECGSAPTFAGAVDCDKKKDEVCCILI